MKLNTEQRSDLVRGLASATSLCGLLVGVPILLIFGVGWPLPQGTPSGSEALNTLKTGAISPSLILKPISLVVWVLWLQMLAGVGIELWAHFHGRVAPRVSFIPLFMQSLSARLMGTALVIALSIQQPGTALAANEDLLVPPTLEADVRQSWSVESDDESTPADPNAARSEVQEYEAPEGTPFVHTVERRDSLRMLAERYLGNPNRWTEVFVLNQGQTQADGGSLTDPAQLRPGWQLVMPADARVPTSTDFAIDEAQDGSQQSESSVTEREDFLVTVQEGDTLWRLAAHHLGNPERWVDLFDNNRDVIQDPSVIWPGWHLRLPAQDPKPTKAEPPNPSLPELDNPVIPVMAYTTAKPTVVASIPATADKQSAPNTPATADKQSAPNTPATADKQSAPNTPATADKQSAPNTPATADKQSAPNTPATADKQSAPNRQAMFAVGGLGVFASSLGWVLVRLRKTQRHRVASGRMPLPLSSTASFVNEQLKAASDPDSALFLDASLRVMSARIASSSPPDIVGVTLDSDSVSIHLTSPLEAPPGFLSSKDSTTWTLLKNASLEHLLAEADGVPSPLPALATVGKGNGKECLLNLEYMAALNLEGDPEAIIDLCAAMATQLASSHLADDLSVLCVGFGRDLAVFERVEYEPDATSALERINQQRLHNQALLGNQPPVVESRIGCTDDYPHPMIALVPTRLSEKEASHLLEACGSSICVVAHGLDGAHWVGRLDDLGLLLQPIGLRLEAHGLAGSAVAAVAELASSASSTEGVLSTAPPTSPLTQIQHSEFDADPSFVDIEVRVMGTVDVLGTDRPFTSRRALDLVAYLAFHPEGADRDQLKAQIWPLDDPPSESTMANTLSRARKALGVNDASELYLPRVGPKGTYRLTAEVGTDVGRFEALVSLAHSDPSERGRERLQTALKLVRGTPFTGGTGDMYRWADFGLRTQIDCLVDTAAHELAKRCIEVGDSSCARWAAMTSLGLVGICEECYRWRLIAAAENPTEVRQIMAELANLLKRESNQSKAGDLLSADLTELYEQLMSGRAVFS